MAWYDDPSLVNPDMLPQDDTTGLVPALPAAPVAVRPSPFAAINQQLEQDLQRMQQPQGLQNLPPMGPSYSPEEWAALQAQNQPQAEQPGVLSDVGNLLKRGYAGTAQGINWLASKTPGLNAIPNHIIDWQGNADQWKQTTDEATQALSQKQQAADKKKFFNDDWTTGEAWSDPRSYLGGAVGSVPGTIAGMAAGGPITGGLAKIGGAILPKLGIGLATEAATGVAGAAASKAVPKLTEKAVERLTMGAGAVGYGAGEGLVAAGSDAAQARDLVLENRKLVEESSPFFKELVAQGKSKDEALLEIADTVAQQVGLRAGLTVGLLGAPMGAVFGKWFHGAGGKPLSKSALGEIGIGMGGEAGQEFPQSGFEQFYQNQAMRDYADPNQPLMEGVADAAVKGAIGGAIMGGVMGGAGHFSEGAGARSDYKSRLKSVKANLPFVPDEAIANELKRVTEGDIPNMAKKAAQDYRGLLETEQTNRQGDQYLQEAAKVVAGEIGKTEKERNAAKIEQALLDPRATQVVERISDDLSQYGGDLNELKAYAAEQARMAFENSVSEDAAEEIKTAERNRGLRWVELLQQIGKQVKAQEAEKAAAPTSPTTQGTGSALPVEAPVADQASPPSLNAVPPAPPATPIVPSAPVITDPKEMGRRMVEEALARKQAEKKSELPPIERPDPTVVVGGVPVKAVTDQANSILDAMHRLKSTLSAVADQKRQAAQTPEAPAQLPTPPTHAPLDASPAASSPELAPSQDLSSNASVGDEAGSVAQTDAGVLKEQEAIGVGSDPKKLQSRLNAAKQVLKTDVRNQFKDAVFDYENKRLVSSDGKLALQWVLRDKPNEPASYENQQTSRGAVRLINLSETSPTPTLAESAHQPTTENQNDSRSQEGQGQAEALLSNDQQTPASQEAGANPPVNTPNTGASNATQDRQEQQSSQPERQGTGGRLEEGRGDRQQSPENQATSDQASGSDQPGQSGTEVTPNVASPQENEAPPAKSDILGENVPGADAQGVGKGEVGPAKKAPTKKTSKSTEPDLSPANREERQQAKRAEFLADPKFRDAMEGYARTAGWDQVGGLPITNDGSISGRLPWIPKDPWFQKSVGARKGLSLDAIPRLIRQFGRGEAPTTKPATNLLDFLIDDYIEGQALEEEARWLSDQLTPDEQVLLDRLTAELENHPAFGRDRLEMLLEKLAKQYPDITPAQFNRALIKTYEITLNGLNPSASQPETASATGQATPGSAGTADQGTSSETSSEPILSSYSQADLDAETARVKDEIERQKQADAAAEAKKKADQERDSSALIGSDNAADLAAPTEPTVFPKDGTPAEKLAYLKTVPENARNNEYRRAVSAALVERLNLALPEGWKAEFNSEKHQHTLTDPKGVVRRTFNAPTVGNGTLSSWLDTATELAKAEKTIKPEPTKTPEVAVEPQTGDDAQVGKEQTETKATPPVASLKPEFGANNTLVSRYRAEELKKRLKAKLNGSQLNSGIDPEILAIGTELTVFYLEGGVRKFADLARTIAAELGVSIDQIKPFVRGWYNGARDTMEDAGLSIDGIDTPEQVREAIKTLTAEDHQDANSPAASTTPADDKTGVAGSKPEEVRATGETGNAPDVSDGSSGTDAGILRHGAGLLPGSDGSIHEGQSDQGRSPVSTGTVSGILEPNPSGLPELPERFYEDYRLPVGGLERTGSWTETAKRNVDILELATKITQENRPATKEEQELLVKYVGFGAGEIRNKLFPPATPEELDQYPNANQRIIPEITANHLSSSMSPAEKARWVDLATRLSNLLSPEDQKTLLRSTQYAHYTSESIIRSIWNAMAQFGFNGGTIMEPGMGIGSFAMAMPEGIARNSRYMGIEMDGPTAMVAKLLLPLQVVNHADFTKQAVPNDLFDAAIGNPPFAKTVILSDPKYAAAKFKLHDYFFAKTIDSVRPGGLLVFVTSRYTMDKQNVRARKYLAERADFMGAIRLPQTAFRDNAGTDVVTDVIFLRKKIPGQNTTGLDWTALAPLATKDGEVQVNEYFVAHPDMILGQPRLTGNTDDQGRRINGLHPGDLTVVSYDASAADLEAKFAQAITNLPSNIYSAAGQDANTLRGATAQRDFAPKTNREGALYQDQTGALLRVENGVGVPLNVLEPWLKDKQLPFVKDYIDLLAQVRAAKMSQWEDGNWQEELDKLNAAYDAFRNNHGPLRDYTVQRRVHSDLKTVWGDLTEDDRTAVIQLAGLSISPTQAWDKKLKAETKRAIADAMSNRDALPTSIRDALGRVIPEEEALTNDSRKYKNKTLLDLDSDSAIIHALEHINEKGEIVKSPFLKGRTIRQPQQRTVSSPQDALAVSLDQKGYLDLADVAAQMQTTEAEAIKNLGDLLYQTPTGQWQMADEYLSGDVVTKLAEAVLAAKQNPELERNIKALETVQPLPKGIGDISANLGAGWIDAHYVEDFAREVLNLPATITYDPATATWIVHEAGGTGSRNARGAAHDWGILNIKTPHEILAAALSGVRIIISNTVRNGNTTTTVRDEDNTVLANDLVKRMREAFKAWVWTDPTRVQDLTANYNEKHNRLAGRKFDGSHLTLPGLSLRYPSIHPHQLRAIWRIIQTGNTYAAHAVGSGKTLEMIISGMEQRRLGLIQRPIYVVPNHMLEQFSSEFMDAYPTANIMVADDENFTGDVRRRFVARAALNNPDAIILTHSSFKLIGMNEEAIAPIKNKILSDIQDALNDLGKDQETRVLRSRLEQQLEQAEQRFDKMLGAKRDTAITFDELGADFIFYDEAHAARKLDFTTNLQLKGIDPQGSFQALDLYIKTRWLESRNKGRSFVFASGTPVTNTMGELYSLMRFFDEEALRQAGVHTFDAWAAMFGEVALEYEPDAQGILQPVERFSKFNNLPALMSRVRSFMDILTSSQLRDVVKGIPRIEGNNQPQMVEVQKSEDLADYMRDVLGPRLEASRKWKPSKEQRGNPDPIMAINQTGLLASIDMRFTDPTLPNDPNSKLNKMIDEIIADHQDIADLEYVDRDGSPMGIKGGTQIVFYNVGFGAGVLERRGFDARAWVNKRLRDAGIPANEIAWFDDANDDAKKERIFQDMRSGKIKILFGSAKKMGTGVNVQNRLKVLHYLDPPWYPSDVEQPFGRILRQGNQNLTVRIKTYGTVGTYEASQWGILARKMRFIEQALSGDNSLNSMEDISAASMYEQAAAIVAGDPRFKVLADLTNRIKQLEALRSAHQQGQGNLVGKKRSLESKIELSEGRIGRFKQAESILGELAKKALFEHGEVNGQRFTKRGEFGEELAKEVNKRLDEAFSMYHKPVQVATINNILPVMLETEGEIGGGGYVRTKVYIKVGKLEWEIFWGSSTNSGGHRMAPTEAGDKVGSALHKVGNTASVRENDESDLVNTREELKNTTAMIGQPFAEERVLADMIVERNRLLQKLSQAAPQQPVPADDRLIAIAEAAKRHQDQAKQIALYDTPADYVNRLLAQIPGMRGEQERLDQERKGSKPAHAANPTIPAFNESAFAKTPNETANQYTLRIANEVKKGNVPLDWFINRMATMVAENQIPMGVMNVRMQKFLGDQWDWSEQGLEDAVAVATQKASARPQFSLAADETTETPILRSARELGESRPNLTPLEVLAMAESGGAVSNAEWEILQAYLNPILSKTPALGVDSPSFKEWFGKSKIVSRKTGKPIRMYHATTSDFTEFDLGKSGKNTSHPTASMGFFFTNDRSHAAAKYGDNVMEVYLAIERPYLMTDADLHRIDGIEEAKAFRDKLIAQGYDGIVMPHETATRYVAAFYPDQIKLTDNETYTRGVNDIRRSVGSNQNPTGLDKPGFIAALKQAFPHLSEAINKVLARGERGEKGGTVLIDSNDPNEIARIYAEKTRIPFAQALKELSSDSPNLIKDQQSRLQGWYSPRAGIIFAILPNLSTRSAPAVFLHETKHSQQRDDLTRRAVDLINQRTTIKGPQLRAFLDRVYARMAAAGVVNKDGVITDINEAAPYIVEQAVLEGRQNGFNYADGRFLDWVDAKIGKPVGDLIRKLVNFIRATMLRRGFNININKLAVDDLVNFARIGVEKAARGDVRVVDQPAAFYSQADDQELRSLAINNIRSGIYAFNQSLDKKESVNSAVYRPELGWIDFEYGNPGITEKNYKRGFGLSHLLARRGVVEGRDLQKFGMDLVKTLALGTAGDVYGYPGDPRVDITLGTLMASVSLKYAGKDKRWLLTAFHDRSADAAGRNDDLLSATQAEPYFTRLDLGAALATRLTVPDDVGKVVDDIGVNQFRNSLTTAVQKQNSIRAIALIGKSDNSEPTAAELTEAQRQYDAVVSRYKGTNQWMKAPNGEDTKLNERQWIQAQTENFKKWFDGSQVVDENGEPLVVYHGSAKSNLTKFDRRFAGTGVVGAKNSRGFYFADTYDGARGFSDPIELPDGTIDDRVYEVFLSIKNPSIAESSMSDLRKVEATAEADGYDGVIANDVNDGEASNVFIAFSPNQIKSAISNVGTFGETDDIRYSYAGPSARTADQSLLQQDTGPQFSIAPTESLPELEKISETLDEAGGWNTNRAEEKTIIDRLRDVADKSRSKWVKMLTRQQLVELISHIPDVGPLAQAFEKTARNLDAMKQELKQLVYPVAERWRDGIVRSRDNGYLLSKIIRASTLHGVDPLGDPPMMVGGQNPQQRAELAEKARWHTLVKQWMKELETKDPVLAKVYKESRDNYEMMREKRYEALMARIGRSGNSMVRALLDQAEKGVNEVQPEALVAQLRDLKTADTKQYQLVRGAILSAFPNFKPAGKGGLPAAKPIAQARAGLGQAGKTVFDAVVADLQENTLPGEAVGHAAKTRYNRLFGQADRLVKEALNPEAKAFGRRMADLFESSPKAFKELRAALVNYLNQPDALLTIRDIADPSKPGKTSKKVELTDLANSAKFNNAMGALPQEAQKLFKETLTTAQNRMADHASTVKGTYETLVVHGPYAPLSRFGDYQVYAEKDGQPLPIYATFENASEQLRAVKALKEEGWTVSVGHQIEDSIVNSPPSGSFIGALFGIIDDTVRSEKEQALLKDDVYQLYLHSLPDMSASKHFVHRKGIPGFSQDALRAYAQLMNQSANAIARLNYSDIMQEQLQDMSKGVKQLGLEPTDENIAFVNQAAPVVSELNNSYEWLMNPSNATLANRLTGLGFFWYLTNFSTSLVNLTQTPLMTFPDLAAKYGAKEAFNVLFKTIIDYGNWKFRHGSSKKAVIDAIGRRFDGDMQRMLDHIEKSGAVSRTETVMLADMGEDVAEFQTSKPMVVASAIKNFFSWPFQKSEVANREIAAIAAYTLARNKGMGHQQAQDIAYNVVFRTQNDYSNANRAAFMRGDIARVLFLFRSFSQMMTWRWLRDAHQMFKAKGVDPETGIPLKTIARDRVKWMLVSSFMFSGTMGLPIYAATMGIASMIAALVSDPDDPWDVETEVNQGIQAAMMVLTNHKGSADILRRGFMSGPIGSLTGIDLSPRVSMDLWRLWFRKVPGDKEGEDLGLAYLQQAAGPVVGGLGIGAVKGMSDLGKALEQRDGTLASRGLETMIPAPLRNALKTLRYYSEGVTTRRGDKIVDDPTKLDLIRQFIGFTPAEIADQYERNAAVKEVERALQQRRKNLTNRYVYALEQQDQDGVDSALEAIANFGLKNPQIAISFNTLSQAYRQRQRAKMMSENGLYIPSKGMRARLEGEGY